MKATHFFIFNEEYYFYNFKSIQNEDICKNIISYSNTTSNKIIHISKALGISKNTVKTFFKLNSQDKNALMQSITKKSCAICKQIKDKNNFSKTKKITKWGEPIYNCYCNICQIEYTKTSGLEYRKNNKEKIIERWNKYKKNNKEAVKIVHKKYVLRKTNIDPYFKFKRNFSLRMTNIFKIKDKDMIYSLFGYSLDNLKIHLESKFESWMNWSNWGKYNISSWDDNDSTTWKWNIDHIIPQSSLKYKTINDENFKKCWALDNLRPLSAKENLIKSNKII
jgi:hypothetical protein